jgi:hypothetical protein
MHEIADIVVANINKNCIEAGRQGGGEAGKRGGGEVPEGRQIVAPDASPGKMTAGSF